VDAQENGIIGVFLSGKQLQDKMSVGLRWRRAMNDDSKAVIEVAKGVQEASKFGGKVTDAVTSVGSFLNRLAGQPLEDVVGMALTDPIRAARVLSLDWYARRVDEILQRRNIRDKTKPVSPSIVGPILDAAQDETREELRELWATLLANAMDPSRDQSFRLEFIDTLRRMNPLDAVILKKLKETPNINDQYDFFSKAFSRPRTAIVVSLKHLEELGCVGEQVQNTFIVAAYGHEIINACRE
jgi:hypothetical protein